MKATIEYVKRKFDEFNTLCFDGVLPPLPIYLGRARHTLGTFTYREKEGADGKKVKYDMCIRISVIHDMEESVLEDTIIHEMIHYWVAYKGFKTLSSHDHHFMSKMREINHKYHRNISVTHHSTEQERQKRYDADNEIRHHYLCIAHLHDGRLGVASVARTRVYQLWSKLPQIPGVKSHQWYYSRDPYFNRIRRVITPKFYIYPAEEVLSHLSDARQMVHDGKAIIIK